MPYQPRPSLPARCASLPPLHLECPPPERPSPPPPTTPTTTRPGRLSTIPEEETTAGEKSHHFPWARLPKEIQQRVLRDALTWPPDTAPFGGHQYRALLRETAVPLFLGLGRWDAYFEAAAVLYRHVCITPAADSDAVVALLASPATLRVRNLVQQLAIHVHMPHDLGLFDDAGGLSSGARTNVPTALHHMRVHGRLRKVDLSLYMPDLQACHDEHGATLQYPMARLQIARRDGSGLPRDVQPGRIVIAPAFLASRAFQSGLLPLLERNVFESSTLTVRLFSAADHWVHEKYEYDIRSVNVDGHRVFMDWFGATKVEDLPEETRWLLPGELPSDMFPFVPDEDRDETMDEVAELDNATAHGIEAAEYRERGDDLLSSPMRCAELSNDALPGHKTDCFFDGPHRSPTHYSDVLSDDFSSCVEAVSEATVPTYDDVVGAVGMENAMPDQEAPAAAEQPLPWFRHAQQVDAEATRPAVDSMPESDSEIESDDSSSGSSVSDSSENTVLEHQSQRIVQPVAPEAKGHPLSDEDDSDSSDDGSDDECPSSRSTAFAKKKNASPHATPLPARMSDNNSVASSASSDDTDDTDMSIDSSSSEHESNPPSPTIDISRYAGQHRPSDDGGLVMTGALPSSDVSFSSSSESDNSEEASDSEESSSSDEGGKLSSKTPSQVEEFFATRAGPEHGHAGTSLSGRKVEESSSSTSGDSESDSDASSSSAAAAASGSDTADSDSDGSSSDSDSAESSSDELSARPNKPCPKCGDLLPVLPTSQPRNNTSTQGEGRPASRTTKPAVASTPPAQSTAANKHRGRPTHQGKGLHGSSNADNNRNNTTPPRFNKRKTPPQSADGTPLTKRQRKNKRYWAQRRMRAKSEAAQQAGRP